MHIFFVVVLFLFSSCTSYAWDSVDTVRAVGEGFKIYMDNEQKAQEERDREIQELEAENAALEAQYRKTKDEALNRLQQEKSKALPSESNFRVNLKKKDIVGTWAIGYSLWHLLNDKTFIIDKVSTGDWSIQGNYLIIRMTNNDNPTTWRLQMNQMGNLLQGTWATPSSEHGNVILTKHNAELNGAYTYNGIDVRTLITEATTDHPVVKAMVCCEELETNANFPRIVNGNVLLRIRMKKDAVIQIVNNEQRSNMTYRCDQPNECTKFFQVAYASKVLSGIDVRTYCKKPAETSLDGAGKAYVGFTLWEGQVTIDGTDRSPISCMPKTETANATDKLETKKSRKKAAR
jgi:hypothetical protein